jgi:hypothetical protein
MVVYMDDCLIFDKDDATIDELVANLSKTFLLEDQGTVTERYFYQNNIDDSNRPN